MVKSTGQVSFPVGDIINVFAGEDLLDKRWHAVKLGGGTVTLAKGGELPWGVLVSSAKINKPVGVIRAGGVKVRLGSACQQFDLLGPDGNGTWVPRANGLVRAEEDGKAGELIDGFIGGGGGGPGGVNVQRVEFTVVTAVAAQEEINFLTGETNGTGTGILVRYGELDLGDSEDGWLFNTSSKVYIDGVLIDKVPDVGGLPSQAAEYVNGDPAILKFAQELIAGKRVIVEGPAATNSDEDIIDVNTRSHNQYQNVNEQGGGGRLNPKRLEQGNNDLTLDLKTVDSGVGPYELERVSGSGDATLTPEGILTYTPLNEIGPITIGYKNGSGNARLVVTFPTVCPRLVGPMDVVPDVPLPSSWRVVEALHHFKGFTQSQVAGFNTWMLPQPDNTPNIADGGVSIAHGWPEWHQGWKSRASQLFGWKHFRADKSGALIVRAIPGQNVSRRAEFFQYQKSGVTAEYLERTPQRYGFRNVIKLTEPAGNGWNWLDRNPNVITLFEFYGPWHGSDSTSRQSLQFQLRGDNDTPGRAKLQALIGADSRRNQYTETLHVVDFYFDEQPVLNPLIDGVYVIDIESIFDWRKDQTAVSKIWINGQLLWDMAVNATLDKHNTFDSVVSGAPRESGPRNSSPSILAGGTTPSDDIEICYLELATYQLSG